MYVYTRVRRAARRSAARRWHPKSDAARDELFCAMHGGEIALDGDGDRVAAPLPS